MKEARELLKVAKSLLAGVKPYQVAWSNDKSLLYRKWDFVGTVWAESPKSAAYIVHENLKGKGDIVDSSVDRGPSTVYKFADGKYIRVGFGT
jgi:hypothetical protein